MSNKSKLFKGFNSTAIHGNNSSHPKAAHLTPIYATSTFTFDTANDGMERFAGKKAGYIYSRWGNPTFTDAENVIAALEAYDIKNEDGLPLQLKAILHASGQAALSTLLMSTLQKGDKILTHYSLYGGTHEMMKLLADDGIETVVEDLRNVDAISNIAKNHPEIKLVHLETPANPTIQCVDIEAISKIAKANNWLLSVDNTFATPYLQQPFKYGADFVMHSTTKFLNGHGTAIGGVLLGRDVEFMNTKATKWHRLLGGNSNPFDAFLLLQGMKTLGLRMDVHCNNAKQVAEFLQTHDAVQKVNFVGLPDHPDHKVAQKQMSQFGAMLSFELKKGLEGGITFIDKLQMCVRAVSLGTVDTLISHPASMSHVSVPKAEREKYGITDGLIRMSVGIENIEDIIADLEQALASNA